MEKQCNECKNPILEVKDLRVKFSVHKKWLPAVDGVNLCIQPGEIIGVVGESGSGNSPFSVFVITTPQCSTRERSCLKMKTC